MKGKLFAKTGYIQRVSTLSGYIAKSGAQGGGQARPAASTGDKKARARVAEAAGRAESGNGKSNVYWTFVILLTGFPTGGLAATHRFQEDVAVEIFRRF